MYDGEEDCVLWSGFAVIVEAIAEDEAKGIGCLMPSASSLHLIRFFRSGKAAQTRPFVRIGKISRGQAISEEFGKGAASGSATGVGEIVMDVGFAVGGEEEEPILFDL